jgi:hypothetical protein
MARDGNGQMLSCQCLTMSVTSVSAPIWRTSLLFSFFSLAIATDLSCGPVSCYYSIPTSIQLEASIQFRVFTRSIYRSKALLSKDLAADGRSYKFLFSPRYHSILTYGLAISRNMVQFQLCIGWASEDHGNSIFYTCMRFWDFLSLLWISKQISILSLARTSIEVPYSPSCSCALGLLLSSCSLNHSIQLALSFFHQQWMNWRITFMVWVSVFQFFNYYLPHRSSLSFRSWKFANKYKWRAIYMLSRRSETNINLSLLFFGLGL